MTHRDYCEDEVRNAAQIRTAANAVYKRALRRAADTGHPTTHIAAWAGVTEHAIRAMLKTQKETNA